tara:strand:+ start:812 stop:1318 length:507 start_codon:yes stop_codon:yes gene_type:complete
MHLNYLKLIIIFLTFSTKVLSQTNIPAVYVKTTQGKSINTINTLNNDGLTVYSFWATWCIPCINELDAIHNKFDIWKDYNVKIIAVSTDDARTKRRVRPLINGKNWRFNILLDENQNFKRSLNISGIPHVIVTKGREIIYRRVGYKPGDEDNLLEIIFKNSKIQADEI